ncbi:MAG TPA: PEP-CTERM sorting domain-containing protein [Candidatus Acidoferrum sp.]|nr:PEP-CTERM sorting domain-containing protein [Candidatus Acidoferrum sp.]
MKTILGKIGLVAAALLFSSILLAPAAKADTITYTFTGEAGTFLGGTTFTYVTTSFLSFDTGKLTPTTAGTLFAFGVNLGTVSGFDFIAANDIKIYGAGTNSAELLNNADNYFIGSATAGENVLASGTLVITDVASVAAEPSTLGLLAAGVAGLFGLAFIRKRKTQSASAAA